MRKQLGLSFAIIGAVALPLMGGTPAQADTRTWVSGTGDDSMPCTRTQPCQTFAVAIGKTAAGGYITCLDPGPFGPVTITKAITIECDEATGHILANADNAIQVNAPAGSAVTLRGLSVEGGGAAGGIVFIGQGSLTVQDVVIQGFNGNGIHFAPSGGGTSVLNVSNDTLIFNNGGNGILIVPSGGSSAIVVADGIHVDTNGSNGVLVSGLSGAADLTFRNSVASRNTGVGVGVMSGGVNRTTALVEGSTLTFNANTGFNLTGPQAFGWISTSTVNGNGTGVSSSGTLQSFKDNRIIDNGIDGTPMNPVPGVSGFLQ